MQDLDRCRKLNVLKPEGIRHVGNPELKWLESGEEDPKMGRKQQDREQWRTILEEAEVHQGL